MKEIMIDRLDRLIEEKQINTFFDDKNKVIRHQNANTIALLFFYVKLLDKYGTVGLNGAS